MFTWRSETRREPVRLRWVRLDENTFYNLDTGNVIEFTFRDKQGKMVSPYHPQMQASSTKAALFSPTAFDGEEPYRNIYYPRTIPLYEALAAETATTDDEESDGEDGDTLYEVVE